MLRPDKFIDIWLVDGPVSVVYLKVRLIINNFWKPNQQALSQWVGGGMGLRGMKMEVKQEDPPLWMDMRLR